MLLDILKRLEIIIKEMEQHTDIQKAAIELHDGHKVSITSLYYDMKRKISDYGKDDRIWFLIVPVIEDFIEKTKPYYHVTIDEVMNGTAQKKAEHLEKLITSLHDSEINKQWKTLEEEIQRSIQSMGLPYNEAEMEKLVYIFPAIEDALMFLKSKANKIIKLQKGRKSDAVCKVIPYISLHTTISGFYSLLKFSNRESFITFGAILPTMGMAEDKLECYLQDRPCDVRIENFSRNTKKSYDEVRNEIDIYNCEICIGIKNGENIWVIHTQAAGNNYYVNTLKDYSDFFDYGKRRTYLPIQVFFDDKPPANTESKELAIVRNGYWLKDIIDCQQSVWVVTVLSEIRKMFYIEEREEETLSLLGETIATSIALEAIEGKNTSVVETYFPSVIENRWCITLDDLIETEEDKLAIQEFAISEKDFKGTPLYTNKIGYESQLRDSIIITGKSILANILAKKIKITMSEYIEKNESIIRQHIEDRRNDILQMLKEKNNALAKCTIICENQKPELRLDGTMVYCHNDIKIAQVGVYEGRGKWWRNSAKWFYPEELRDKKPPVYVKVRPRTENQLYALLGLDSEKVPLILKYYGLFFEREIAGNNGNSILHSNSFIGALKRACVESKTDKLKLDIFDVDICFGKREFKKLVGYPTVQGGEAGAI